jgi:hypothetical protein
MVPERFLRELPSLDAQNWWEHYENERLRDDLNYEVLGQRRHSARSPGRQVGPRVDAGEGEHRCGSVRPHSGSTRRLPVGSGDPVSGSPKTPWCSRSLSGRTWTTLATGVRRRTLTLALARLRGTRGARSGRLRWLETQIEPAACVIRVGVAPVPMRRMSSRAEILRCHERTFVTHLEATRRCSPPLGARARAGLRAAGGEPTVGHGGLRDASGAVAHEIGSGIPRGSNRAFWSSRFNTGWR